MKILVIDDDIPINKLISLIAKSENHKVLSAYNGVEGLDVLKKNDDIDLVITDIIMPEKEGIETIIEIKKNYKHVKIIAISGGGKLNPDGYLILAKELGADRVLKKPFDDDTLIDMIKSLE